MSTEPPMPEPAAAFAGDFWGAHELLPGQAMSWRLGPLAFSLRRPPNEWRLAWERDGDLHDARFDARGPVDASLMPESGQVVRVASGDPSPRFVIWPALPDRALVARPEVTFRILPQARISLFVSVPVWLRIEVGEPGQEVLEAASWRLSDTWFGSPQGEGELCYSIHTNARLHLDNLPRLPHRAIARVEVCNRATDSLTLERLNLPVRLLSLFRDQDGHLWTQRLMVERGRDGKLAEIDLGKGVPEEAGDAELMTGPRDTTHRNVLVRAIGGLFL